MGGFGGAEEIVLQVPCVTAHNPNRSHPLDAAQLALPREWWCLFVFVMRQLWCCMLQLDLNKYADMTWEQFSRQKLGFQGSAALQRCVHKGWAMMRTGLFDFWLSSGAGQQQ